MRRVNSSIAAILAAVINIAAALLIGAVLILAIGESPMAALGVVWTGAFGSVEGVCFTLYYATNFIFTGLAVAVAANASEYNIGGEGQAYIGGLAVGLLCFALPGMPWPVALTLGSVVAMVAGMGWAFVPAYMSAYRGSHLVITTIMFNFLASLLMIYVIVNYLRPFDSMIPASGPIADGLAIPRIDQILTYFGWTIRETPLNLSIFLALAASAGVTFLIWHTRWGFELRAVGENREAAAYSGVRVRRMVVQAICLSGGLAGLVGVNEILGVQHRVLLDFAAGLGFTGIAVALIGANHPAGIIAAAILFGALTQGGATLSFMFPKVSREVVIVLQGLVILFAGGLVTVLRPYLNHLLDSATTRLLPNRGAK